jgi:hypothetical protein
LYGSRRRIFGLFDAIREVRARWLRQSEDDIDPIFVARPWWLSDIAWRPASTSAFINRILIGGPNSTLGYAILFLVIFATIFSFYDAVSFQKSLSNAFSIRNLYSSGEEIKFPELYLFGPGSFFDFAPSVVVLLLIILVLSVEANIRPLGATRSLSGMMPRRRFLVAGGAVALTGALAAVAVSSVAASAFYRGRFIGQMTRLGLLARVPRYRVKTELAILELPPGWYHLPGRSRDGSVAHFVRESGSAKNVFEGLSAVGARSVDPLSFPLDRGAYSEGLERVALEMWSAGRRDEALMYLRHATDYAIDQSPANVRVFDLLAGLYVRVGRTKDLDDLVKSIQRQRAFDGEALTRRAAVWTRVDSRWRRSWDPARTPQRSWNGVAI